MAVPRISFLIAADDHPPDLDLFFAALLGQTLSPDEYEVIYVDAVHSHDRGRAHARVLACKDPRLHIQFEQIEKGGRARAYNHGLRLCRAPIILFFGDDNIAAPATAEVHLRFHEDHPDRRCVGIGAAIIPPALCTHFSSWLEQSGGLFGVPFSRDMTAVPEDFFYTSNASVKRDLVLEAGPFDQTFRHHVWDDFELGLRLRRLGMKATFLPGIVAEHHDYFSLAARCRVMTMAGEGAAAFDGKRSEPLIWRRKRWVPTWCFRFLGWAAAMGHAWSGRERYLLAHYRLSLTAAFAAGYRRVTGSDDPVRRSQ